MGRLLLLILSPLVWLGLLEVFAWATGHTPLVEDASFLARDKIYRCRWGREALEKRCDAPWSSDGRRGIFVYGGSSVIVRPWRQSLSVFLQQELDARHPGEYAVRNLALPCRDSFYVRECVERSLGAGPELIVVYSGHNDFGGYLVAWPRARMWLARFPWLIDLRRAAGHTRTWSLLAGGPEGGLDDGSFLERPDADFDLAASQRVVIDTYRRNLEHVADLAAAEGIPLLLVTVVSNLDEWPFPREEWDAVVARAGRADAPRWLALYAEGIGHARAGRGAEALRAFKSSRDLLYPSGRASSALNETLRALSDARPGVHVVDFEVEIDAIGEREGVGCNLFDPKPLPCDHVHPNLRTNRLLGHAVARRVLELR